MAKTESTAVNELIELVQSNKPLSAEPAADLFSVPPAPQPRVPRMTATVPPMRGAGEVAPLPRGRAPQATSQHSMPQLPPQVRMSTADPERGNTIPPISQPTRPRASAPALPPPRQTPRATSQVRAQSPALPPPRPSSAPPIPQRASTSSLPPPRPRTTSSVPALPPPSAPVAAPFESRGDDNPFIARPAVPQQFPIVQRPVTVDVTGDVVKAENWFGDTAAIHKADEQTYVGTSPVTRKRERIALAKKLIAPAIIAAVAGAMIGGYFAFMHNRNSKQTAAAPAALATHTGEEHVVLPTTPAAAPAQAATTPSAAATTPAPAAPAEAAAAAAAAAPAAAAPPAPSAEPVNAATANPAGDQPQPPTKAEEVARAEAAAQAAITHDAPASAKVVEAVPPKAVATSAAPAAVREVQTTQGVVKLVDVRINSKPAGATVMLVDDGKTSLLGSTPLATSLDPAKKYDVIFTLAGRPTQMAPLDPSKTSKLDVTLGRAHHDHHSASAAAVTAPAAPAAAPAPAPAPTRAPARTKRSAPSGSIADPFAADLEKPAKADKAAAKTELAKSDKADKPAKAEKKVAAAAAGDGTLMVSSKPPCEILIDGKATGLTTPQRSIPLSAGTHKITFVNDAQSIKKTVSVAIKPDQSTKLIQDLMQ